jgi:ferritin-like metal-binding protein YciE
MWHTNFIVIAKSYKLIAMPQTKSKNRSTSSSGSTNSRSRSTSTARSRSAVSGASRQPGQAQGTGGELEKYIYDSLKDIYWAEKHLLKAIPRLSKAATSEELISALDEHLEVTEEHVARLEQVFEKIGRKAQGKKCEAMQGLTDEAETVISETEDGTSTRDVAIIMAAQKVEHYEIATYGGLAQLAKTMGMAEVADLLGQTLQEEKDTDANLTTIAENSINLQAEQESEDEAEE